MTAPPAALSRAEIRDALTGNPPPAPRRRTSNADTTPTDGPRATQIGRCVHCAERVMQRPNQPPYCDLGQGRTCHQGPLVYTGPAQLTELGLLPCPNWAAIEATLKARR